MGACVPVCLWLTSCRRSDAWIPMHLPLRHPRALSWIEWRSLYPTLDMHTYTVFYHKLVNSVMPKLIAPNSSLPLPRGVTSFAFTGVSEPEECQRCATHTWLLPPPGSGRHHDTDECIVFYILPPSLADPNVEKLPTGSPDSWVASRPHDRSPLPQSIFCMEITSIFHVFLVSDVLGVLELRRASPWSLVPSMRDVLVVMCNVQYAIQSSGFLIRPADDISYILSPFRHALASRIILVGPHRAIFDAYFASTEGPTAEW